MTNATPLVKGLAARLGVDLESVRGTGVAGRVRKGDVLDRARELGRAVPGASAGPRAQSALPSVSARTVTQPSAWPGWAAWGGTNGGIVEIDPWGRNPLVDDARQSVPEVYDRAIAASPAPTLFNSGDLPLFMASGADPQLLLQVPAVVRRTAATAGAVQFSGLLEQYSGTDGWTKATHEFGGLAGDFDYYSRVFAWLRSGTPRFVGF